MSDDPQNPDPYDPTTNTEIPFIVYVEKKPGGFLVRDKLGNVAVASTPGQAGSRAAALVKVLVEQALTGVEQVNDPTLFPTFKELPIKGHAGPPEAPVKGGT